MRTFRQFLETYSNPNYYLANYLKGKEFYSSNFIPWLLQWKGIAPILRRAGVDGNLMYKMWEDGDDIESLCDRIDKVITEDEINAFLSTFGYNMPTEVPSWFHMELKKFRLDRSTWLIHFSDQASNIADRGFKKGVSDPAMLAYTCHLSDESKKYGGYNFAFVADGRDAARAARDGKYGDEAVMFQSSGVEVYHWGDEENQVIFWGSAIDPKTIVHLYKDGSDWMVATSRRSSMRRKDREFAYISEFSKVVNWVEKNWFQYRNQILNHS